MPTKSELLRLQKLYRTDKRIAEILGNGVTEHLIAYWRRKKGIPAYSFPKFSEKDIQDAWDRFGDDFHAGIELGISKAAFYNWRRRYKITKKPEALKLEQLSLELFTEDTTSRRRIGTGHQSLIQKTLCQILGRKAIDIDEELAVEPDLVIVAGSISEIVERFQKLGVTYIWNPSRVVAALGPSSTTTPMPANYPKIIRDFARLQQIKYFYDIGEGDSCQLAMEHGILLPGQFVIGSDPLISACGALGLIAVPVGVTEMAHILSGGKYSMRVPQTVRIDLTGKIPGGVFVCDIAHHIMAQLSDKPLSGTIIEFYGSAIEQVSVGERFTLCARMPQSGARTAVCPFDASTRRYLSQRARKQFTPILADRNAVYVSKYTLDVNTMKPVAARADNTTAPIAVDDLESVPINHIYLGGPVAGRFTDLKIAAEILKGKQINADTRLYIQPASRQVYLDALKKGLIRSFVESGAVIITPGSGFGGGFMPIPADGEKSLSTFSDTIQYNGGAEVFSVSPATAAASALTGRITNPVGYLKL